MQAYYIKNISVLLEPESNHSTVKESPVAAPPPPPLFHSPFKGLILPINFHNYLPSSLSGIALLPSALTTTTSSPKTSIKNVSSKDPSGKQSQFNNSNNWFSNACTKAIISCLVNNYITANSDHAKVANVPIWVKQSWSPTTDFQTHVPKPSSPVSSITTSLPTANKIKNLPRSSSKSKKIY